ncbi:PREDICTED: mycophenolic acid acyl-glucuronide esterase, mitochondrial isoform X1 [Thamnophis sirtalis]|uniref:Palmitoyl-protein thioesterase ABHD10, mitochondrial n=2 Tax=Thamnophis sirtalis TaxID=35019 RepID=A0A6I9YXP2_9SAUR|nr:PREDICTED: mycophenolic acid acyl-glucuronide esterase, mitochondrial isoform X1 [Thamnophis sirtalis]
MAVAGVTRVFSRGKQKWGSSVAHRTGLGFPQLLGCKQKSSHSVLNRSDQPKLAYNKLKGRSPGVVFLPGIFSNMNGVKALALEDFCKSVGHAFVRFDYRGCGSSEGSIKECTLGKWRKDVLSVLDELTEGPQILVGSSLGGWLMLHAAIARPEKIAALVGIAVAADHLLSTFQQLPLEAKKEIEEKGEWKLTTKYNEEGFYSVPYELIQEAENHCVLSSPLPIQCPVRLIHGLKDEDIPWQISMKLAENIVSGDVDIILRKSGQHRMKEKDDIKVIVYTVEDLIEQLST